MEHYLLTEKSSSSSSSSSDDDDDDDDDDDNDISSPKPKRSRWNSATEEQDATSYNDVGQPPVIDQEETTADLPAVEDSVPDTVETEPTTSQTTITGNNPVLPTYVDRAVQPPVKRKRGRPRKIRSEAEMKSEFGNSANIPDDGLMMSESSDNWCGEVTTVSPASNQASDEATNPILPVNIDGSIQLPVKRKHGRSRKIRSETETMPEFGNSADVPLYSSTSTEPGEQSSLMVVQPHELANLPFTVGVDSCKNRSETETMPESGNSDDIPESILASVVDGVMMSDMTVNKYAEVGTVSPMNNQASDAATFPILSTYVDGGVQPPIKRKRGRRRKIRRETETMPESGNSANIPESILTSVAETLGIQDSDLTLSDSSVNLYGEVGTVSGPHPMTLSLSPPPMPSGKVPQPAGVLLLPLYSSTATEPGEQSSLMVVQPHELANLPFAVGSQLAGSCDAGASYPPILTPSQPLINPLDPSTTSQPPMYMLPLSNTASLDEPS